MDLRIAENYQIFKQEITNNWKTGVAMTAVAIIVGHVYGKVAMISVVVVTVFNYQLVEKQIRVLSWANMRRVLILVVMFGSNYYGVHSRIITNVAIALYLGDILHLASTNEVMAEQNEILKEHNKKLQEACRELAKLKEDLEKLVPSAKKLEDAKKENDQAIESAKQVVPKEVLEIPDQLHKVMVLFKALMDDASMQESMRFEAELRQKISTMLKAFDGCYQELKPVSEQAQHYSQSLKDSAAELQSNVVLTNRQVQALKELLTNLRNIPTGQAAL